MNYLTNAVMNQIGEKININTDGKKIKSARQNGQKNKNGEYIFFYNFNITPGITCINAPGGCKDYNTGCCFAIKNEKNRKWISKKTKSNFLESQNVDFVSNIIEEIEEIYSKIKKNREKTPFKIYVRIHGSGDYYSNEYFWKWVEITKYFKNKEYEFNNLYFMSYTKEIMMIYDELSSNNMTLDDINIKVVFSILQGFNTGDNTEDELLKNNYLNNIIVNSKRTAIEEVKMLKPFLNSRINKLDTYTVFKKGSNITSTCNLKCIDCEWCYNICNISSNRDIIQF